MHSTGPNRNTGISVRTTVSQIRELLQRSEARTKAAGKRGELSLFGGPLRVGGPGSVG